MGKLVREVDGESDIAGETGERKKFGLKCETARGRERLFGNFVFLLYFWPLY